MKRVSGLAALAAATLLFSGGAASAQPQATMAPSPLVPPAVDHHMHIQGPDAAAELKRMAARLPDMFRFISPDLLREHSGAEALKAMDEAGIEQGVLLSGGYLFASPFARDDHPDIPTLTRRENRYNVEAARRSNGRLFAFVGVSPLDLGAVKELRYWARRPGVTGVKMHLGNSDFDPRSPDQMAKAAAVFRAARNLHLAIVVHARPAKNYDRADVDSFIAEVVSQAEGTPIQIAHAGGGGGLDRPTLQAMEAYADAIARKAPGTEQMVFDLAVVVVGERTPPAMAEQLVQIIRRIGVTRFVFGSDWPSLHSPVKSSALLQSQLPLTRDEWTTILGNRAPYLPQTASAATSKGRR